MMVGGWPLCTELSTLHTMIPPLPPLNLFGGLGETITASPTKDSKSLSRQNSMSEIPGESNIPWRKSNVHHSNNELFVDVLEHLEGTFDS